MKKKIIIIFLILTMFSSGYAFSESVNGSWNGMPIVNLFNQGTALESTDSPAVILNNHVYVPLKALNPIGAELTWDSSNYSVDIKLPKSKDISELSTQFGSAVISNVSMSIDSKGKQILTITSPLDFSKKETSQTFSDILFAVKGFNITEFNLLSVSGKIAFNMSDIREYDDFKINGDELIKRAISNTSSENTKPILTATDIEKLTNSIGVIYTFDRNNQPIAQGSGFMVAPIGLIVTNHHVLNGANHETIKINGQIYQSNFYTFDNPTTDLYGIALNTDDQGKYKNDIQFPYLKLNTTLPKVGDKVYAVGSPKDLENTISEGIVSGIRNVNGVTMIQHTANTDHGSSGGVLFNEYGEVIGVTSSGFDGTSLDFAISASYVQDELNKLK
ncbi:MAG: serine protease [Bacilli bacterium]|nr:serine protease [Bacilli bacterium]